MEKDAVWQAFSETGDPIYYLLYKSMHDTDRKAKEKECGKRSGDFPRPED